MGWHKGSGLQSLIVQFSFYSGEWMGGRVRGENIAYGAVMDLIFHECHGMEAGHAQPRSVVIAE